MLVEELENISQWGHFVERDIEQYLTKRVKEVGGLSLKFTSPGQAGVPDRIVIYQGRISMVELKTVQGIVSAMQMSVIRKLKKHGIDVLIIRSKQEVDDFVSNLQTTSIPS